MNEYIIKITQTSSAVETIIKKLVIVTCSLYCLCIINLFFFSYIRIVSNKVENLISLFTLLLKKIKKKFDLII